MFFASTEDTSGQGAEKAVADKNINKNADATISAIDLRKLIKLVPPKSQKAGNLTRAARIGIILSLQLFWVNEYRL